MSMSALSVQALGRVAGVAGAPAADDRSAKPGQAAERADGGRHRGRGHVLADAIMSLIAPRAGRSSDAAVESAANVADTASSDSGEPREAAFRFAHALMKDLRQLAGEDGAEKSQARQGWGRRDWSDLQQRLQSLAGDAGSQAAAPAQAQVAASPGAPAAAVANAAASAARANAAPAQAVVEEALSEAAASGASELPQPVTVLSAAVHLMRVPSSQLLEAFSALRAATPNASLWAAEGGELDQLSRFLQQLSETVEPGRAAPGHKGWLLHAMA